MKDTIDLFMWGFQQQFRSGVEYELERALSRVGLTARPEVVLIGLLVPGGDRHAICIEPEDGPLVPALFADVSRRAEEIYAANPESEHFYSSRRHDDLIHARLRDLARADALREMLERAPTGEGKIYFVGSSTRVEQHDVHTAIALPAAVVDSVPTLNTEIRERIRIDQSLLHAVVHETLNRCARSLWLPDPGDATSVLFTETDELVRISARSMLESIVVLTGNLTGGALYDALTEIATLRYERRTGLGSILVARPEHPSVVETVKLQRKVRLSEHRAARKLLELSSADGVSLLTDGTHVYGLGTAERYDASSEDLFAISVLGEGAWEIHHDETPLLKLEFGSPKLPRPRLNQEQFVDTVDRLFEDCDREPEYLWELTQAAAAAEHGTMLVISSAAEDESRRLGAQCIRVEPVKLDPSVLKQLTAIDGALLLSPDGQCHAIGAILDGISTDDGDPSRGARFNSALRYRTSCAHATMTVIVSEDGMIDLLPLLRQRIRREAVKSALDLVRAIALDGVYEPERFYKAFQSLEDLAFYLSHAECDEANALRDAMEERRWQEYSMKLDHPPVRPDPEINDSYFLD